MKLKWKENIKAIGLGIIVLILCILSVMRNDLYIIQSGMFGVFAYFLFDNDYLLSNVKRISIASVLLICSFLVASLMIGHVIFIPLIISTIYFIGFHFAKIYEFSGLFYHFPVVIFSVIGINTYLYVEELLVRIKYIGFGCILAVVIALIVSIIADLPFRSRQSGKLSYKYQLEKFRKEHPDIILDGVVRAGILLMVSFIALYFRSNRGCWVVVACSSVLLGPDLEKIYIRGVNMTIGCAVGVLISYFVVAMDFHLYTRMVILVLCYSLMQYFNQNNKLKHGHIFATSYVFMMISITGNLSSQMIFMQRLISIIGGALIAVIFYRIFIFIYDRVRK